MKINKCYIGNTEVRKVIGVDSNLLKNSKSLTIPATTDAYNYKGVSGETWNIKENLNLIKDSEHFVAYTGTDFPDTTTISNTMNSYGVIEYHYTRTGTTRSNGRISLTDQCIKPIKQIFNKVGQKYTLSFEYKSSGESAINFDTRIGSISNANKIIKTTSLPPSADWKKISIKGINESVSEEYVACLFNIILDTLPDGGTISFRKLCLVEGEGAEYYIPHEIPSQSYNLLSNKIWDCSTNVTIINQGVQIQYINQDTYFVNALENPINFKTGDKYTLSFDVSGLKNDNWAFYFFQNTKCYVKIHNGRNVHILTVPKDLNDKYIIFDDLIRNEQSNPFTITNIKLEKGVITNPTWSPAESEITENLISYNNVYALNNLEKIGNETFKQIETRTSEPRIKVQLSNGLGGYKNALYTQSERGKVIASFNSNILSNMNKIAFGLNDAVNDSMLSWKYNFEPNTDYTFSCEILNNTKDQFVFKNCKLEKGINTNPYFTKNINDT